MVSNMDEDSFEVPGGYYIDIQAGAAKTFGHYKTDRSAIEGRCCNVTVYKSLDRGHGNLLVEHVVKVRSFRLSNLDNCTAEEFCELIKKGIEKVVSSDLD